MKSLVNKMWFATAVIACLTFTPSAHAVGERLFHLEVNGSAGYAQASVVAEGKVPTLLQYAGGVVLGLRPTTLLFFGAASDFRAVNQYSDVDPIVGNLRGNRWNLVSPMFGLYLGESFLVRIDGQFLGEYKLANTTELGATIAYRSPLGGRIGVLYKLAEYIRLGAQFEYLFFSKQNISTVGDTDLTNKFTMWQAGLMMALVY